MSDNTHIQWADATFNPVTGCTRAEEPSPQRGNHWQGGRSVSSHGYVLVFQPEHRLADVRGYVYEHRLVMESVLGRPLVANERVRHLDNDGSNNDPSNLELLRFTDRTERTACACGCGTEFLRFDSGGRERRYVSGHNTFRGCRPPGRPRSELGAGLSAYRKADLLSMFDGQCAYGCGQPAAVWDHLVPWSRGGSFMHIGNAVPACRGCNSKKRASADVWAWIQRGWGAAPEAWAQLTTDAWEFGVLECYLDEELTHG